MMSLPAPRSEPPRGRARLRAVVVLFATLFVPGSLTVRATRAADVPSPESHLGYRAGADDHLAPWGEVVAYFEKVDRASDRVHVRVLGESTEGRPYLAALVSSPETIKNLDRYRGFQESLSDPRKVPSQADR